MFQQLFQQFFLMGNNEFSKASVIDSKYIKMTGLQDFF